MSDLIDRQAAIDALSAMYDAAEDWCREAKTDVIKARAESCMASIIEMKMKILKLPPAQPEIIYCGDCKYKDDGIDEDGIPFLKCLHGRSYGGTRINDFCSWAEKREVTT